MSRQYNTIYYNTYKIHAFNSQPIWIFAIYVHKQIQTYLDIHDYGTNSG